MIDHLVTLAVGLLLGGAFGYGYGFRRGVQWARVMGLRRRRPLNLSIDYPFAVAALENAGYKVTRAQERLH